jgi:hypothetical protein
MAFTGSAPHEDGGNLPMQEISAVLMLLGMFLTAMCEFNFSYAKFLSSFFVKTFWNGELWGL